MTTKQVGTLGVSQAAEGRSADMLSGITSGHANLDPNERFFRRVLVQEVIFDPMSLDDKRLNDLTTSYGLRSDAFVKNLPMNTIVGKPVLDTFGGSDSGSQYFFPFFSSHLQLPVKAGEHVWVFYEPGKGREYGFWVSRISEPRSVEDANHTHADRKFHITGDVSTIDKFEGRTTKVPSFANGALIESGGDPVNVITTASAIGDVDEYEKIIRNSDSGKVTDMEPVPRLRKRPGDLVVQGSNNAAIVLGTDRSSGAAAFVDAGNGKVAQSKPSGDQVGNAGTIDLVVGRGQDSSTSAPTVANTLGKQETQKDVTKENPNEGDPDFVHDLGRFYLSMKTDPDGNFQLDFSDKAAAGDPAAVLRTKHVRIIATESIKFVLQPTPGAPESDCAGIVCKDGNVAIVPSATGLLKLGGEDAGMGILCQPLATATGGQVTAPPIVSTIGATVGAAGANGQFSKKVVCK